MSDLATFFDRNLAFAGAEGHQRLPPSPPQRVAVITCLDPRVDPAHFLGIGMGEAIVMRTVGGRVTDEVIASLAFLGARAEAKAPGRAVEFAVVVIHHTDCGTSLFADADFRSALAAKLGADESTMADRAVVDPSASVRIDVGRLSTSPLVPDGVTVTGAVYDLGTGLVTVVD